MFMELIHLYVVDMQLEYLYKQNTICNKVILNS